MFLKILVASLLTWLTFVTINNDWHLMGELWEVPLTMLAGSLVAGFSAEGGGAVAFPVFTKLLQILPADAKQFSLLIQSIGMTMASVFIVSRKIPFYSSAILPAVLGGAMGQITSVGLGLFMVSSQLKWLFTVHIAALGVALFLQHLAGIRRKDSINTRVASPLLFFTGLIGGFLTINIGCGADMVAFIMLTLVLNTTEKNAPPTTVIIMALNSIVGVIIISFTQEWSTWAISAWKTAFPVVIFGAPLGAFLASRVSNTVILFALLFFISLEVASTIYLVPLQNWVLPVFLILLTLMGIIVGGKLIRTPTERTKHES